MPSPSWDPDAARIGRAPLGVPLHPVQVYENLVWTLLYVVARFVLEFCRGDADRGFALGWLSTSHSSPPRFWLPWRSLCW